MTIFIFAGEPSGDLQGSLLLKAFHESHLKYQFEGVPGPLMRNANVKPILQMEDFAVMGFTDVIKTLPKLIFQFYKVRNHILKTNPKAVILIDYPGFNLRLSSHLRKKGYTGKIIQYISPSVWAHGKKRIQTMSETLDLLLTIYPFEKECFKETNLKVEYIGHPLLHEIETNSSKLPIDENLIALFPGSRIGEIKRNLKKILNTAKLLQKTNEKTHFAISIANEKVKPVIEEILTSFQLNDSFTFVSKDETYQLMKTCKTAIAKSGTVTLELALHEKPTVVVYELSFLNRFIAKYLLKVNLPYYCIVNILSNKETFPELIENGFNETTLNEKLKDLHANSEKRELCIKNCKEIKFYLKTHETPYKKALTYISELLC